jgi:endoglycosylceramidase
MSFHVYCAAAAGLPEAPPIRTACNLVEHRTINDAIAQGTRHQEPLLLSEFGATSDVTELRAVVSYADAHSVPWLNWAYCACGDPTGSGRAEAVVYNPKHPPRGSNVNRPSLVAMDVPYALRTAGTPVSSSFDQSTATFRFTYSTESVVTGQRMSGTTVIYPSPLHYPHGYRVKLVGGRVMSRSSHRLVIRARRGASKVTVTVRR